MKFLALLLLSLSLFLPGSADAGVLLRSKRTTTSVRTPRITIPRSRPSTYAAAKTGPSFKVREVGSAEQMLKLVHAERKDQLKAYKKQVKLADKAYKKKQELKRKRDAEYKKQARLAQKKRKAQLESRSSEESSKPGDPSKPGSNGGKPERKQSWLAKFFGSLFSKPESKSDAKKAGAASKSGEAAESAKF